MFTIHLKLSEMSADCFEENGGVVVRIVRTRFNETGVVIRFVILHQRPAHSRWNQR